MFKLNKKHTGAILAVTAIACSNLALAGFFPQSEDDGVFHIGIEGDYLWQSGNTAEITSLGFYQNNFALGSSLPLVDNDPGAGWGGGVDVAYLFPDNRYDISVSYFFLRAKNTENGSLPFAEFFNIDRLVPLKDKLTQDFDSADIMLGTYFKPSKRWLVRLGYGLGFARISQKSTDSFDIQAEGAPASDVFNDTTSRNSFIGLGPKATLGADFKVIKNFYMVGEIGLSVLYGKSKSEFNVGGVVINGIQEIATSNYQEDNYQGALGFEGRLGLAYVTSLMEDMNVNVEAGFKGQSYVNALQDDELTVNTFLNHQPPTNFAVSNIDFDGTYSNFGPYVNLSVDFM